MERRYVRFGRGAQGQILLVIPAKPRSGAEPGRRARAVCPPGQPDRAEPGAAGCDPDLSPGQARRAFRAGEWRRLCRPG